jgi:hypothetical protein
MSVVDDGRGYGPVEVALLRVCWSATDGIRSKRFAPFLPELLDWLRSWHALRHVSAKTIDRVGPHEPGHHRSGAGGLARRSAEARLEHDTTGHVVEASGCDQDLCFKAADDRA